LPNYYIFSLRSITKIPAQRCLVEFEDVLCHSLEGILVLPRIEKSIKSVSKLFRGKNQFKPSLKTEISLKKNGEEQVLILVMLSIGEVGRMLESIAQIKSQFDLIVAYVFDAIIPMSERSKNSWKRKISWHDRAISSLNHLFISASGDQETYKQLYNIPVSVIPVGCDVLKLGSQNTERFIDVIGYGRQKKEHTQVVVNAFNDYHSPRFFYHTDHMEIKAINDFYAHSKFFWKILTRSTIALAYDPMKVSGQREIPFSFLPTRWSECLAAGCLVVGQKPSCPEAEELLFWEDATIEIPEEAEAVVPFLEALLADQERLQAAHRRNYFYALAYHDWRSRIACMLDLLSLPYPKTLEKELEKLNFQRDLAGKPVGER